MTTNEWGRGPTSRYDDLAKVFRPVLFQLVLAERDLAGATLILPLPCERRVFRASKLPPLLPVGLPPLITIAPPDS